MFNQLKQINVMEGVEEGSHDDLVNYLPGL